VPRDAAAALHSVLTFPIRDASAISALKDDLTSIWPDTCDNASNGWESDQSADSLEFPKNQTRLRGKERQVACLILEIIKAPDELIDLRGSKPPVLAELHNLDVPIPDGMVAVRRLPPPLNPVLQNLYEAEARPSGLSIGNFVAIFDSYDYTRTLAHELTHAYVHRLITRPSGEVDLPRWFNEGFALWMAQNLFYSAESDGQSVVMHSMPLDYIRYKRFFDWTESKIGNKATMAAVSESLRERHPGPLLDAVGENDFDAALAHSEELPRGWFLAIFTTFLALSITLAFWRVFHFGTTVIALHHYDVKQGAATWVALTIIAAITVFLLDRVSLDKIAISPILTLGFTIVALWNVWKITRLFTCRAIDSWLEWPRWPISRKIRIAGWDRWWKAHETCTSMIQLCASGGIDKIPLHLWEATFPTGCKTCGWPVHLKTWTSPKETDQGWRFTVTTVCKRCSNQVANEQITVHCPEVKIVTHVGGIQFSIGKIPASPADPAKTGIRLLKSYEHVSGFSERSKGKEAQRLSSTQAEEVCRSWNEAVDEKLSMPPAVWRQVFPEACTVCCGLLLKHYCKKAEKWTNKGTSESGWRFENHLACQQCGAERPAEPEIGYAPVAVTVPSPFPISFASSSVSPFKYNLEVVRKGVWNDTLQAF